MLSVMCDVDCGMLSVGRAVRDVVLLGVCVIGCFECGGCGKLQLLSHVAWTHMSSEASAPFH